MHLKPKNRKKLVLLDIDRVLSNGSIGVLFTEHLFGQKKFPQPEYLAINRAVSLNNRKKISYQKRGEIIIQNWKNAFRGKNKKTVEQSAEQFFRKNKARLLRRNAKQLMEWLKSSGYGTVGISRAFEEILLPIKKFFSIQIIGTKFETKNGQYTGRLENKMWLASEKERELMELLKNADLTTKGSIAFGDTEDDYYMLKFADYPITVYANKALEKIAYKKHWPVYNDLKALWKDLQSGKLFPTKDWLQHYNDKYNRLIMNRQMMTEAMANDEKFLCTVKKYVAPKGRILETGCGLGRTAIALSLAGYRVTAIDNDKDILKIAKINCYNFGKNIKLELLDFFELRKHFKKNSFDAITHEGVLEHFSDNQIRLLLKEQLKIAPVVIFSVPFKSKRNDRYFKYDRMGHRNLWTKKQWKKLLAGFFKVEESKTSHSLRKDDLILVIKQKPNKKKQKRANKQTSF